MRVAVVGGTGSVGAPLVAELARRGEKVRVLSRRPGTGLPAGAAHHAVDLLSGEGLREALAGVEVIVEAANARRKARELLVGGTRRLGEAGAVAGARHHVLISIVGCDRVPLGYYRLKTDQETVLTAGPLPWTLLRATQFHELLASAFATAARWRLRPTGAARFQPIDVGTVAARLADAAQAEPAGRLADLGGPRVETLDELSRAWQRADGRRLAPLRVPSLGGIGRALRDGGLCDPRAATPGPSFEEWLRRD